MPRGPGKLRVVFTATELKRTETFQFSWNEKPFSRRIQVNSSEKTRGGRPQYPTVDSPCPHPDPSCGSYPDSVSSLPKNHALARDMTRETRRGATRWFCDVGGMVARWSVLNNPWGRGSRAGRRRARRQVRRRGCCAAGGPIGVRGRRASSYQLMRPGRAFGRRRAHQTVERPRFRGSVHRMQRSARAGRSPACICDFALGAQCPRPLAGPALPRMLDTHQPCAMA